MEKKKNSNGIAVLSGRLTTTVEVDTVLIRSTDTVQMWPG